MKHPKPPPNFQELLTTLLEEDPNQLPRVLTGTGSGPTEPYIPWDKVRFKKPPDDLTAEQWWLRIKLARTQMQREIPLRDKSGEAFVFSMPDSVLQCLEAINSDARGQISISEQVTNPATRDRYLVNSLIEEAISSSQLEGAATTRRVAKEMIRTGRSPRNKDELMIFNNYKAMRLVGEMREEKMTPDLLCELHRVVTEGTLSNPDASGRFQLPTEDRVSVYSFDEVLLHEPPAAVELPARIEQLCKFANGELDEVYIPPVLRAIILHFMIGYEHPFEDGNGRTARALFYWSMLSQGYWLTEFLTISPILKKAPAKYARSYLYTEQDNNDLTYFLDYHLQVICRAIRELHEYLRKKIRELHEVRSITTAPGLFNYRQLAILERAAKDADATFTVRSHMNSHNVVYETARQDLIGLEQRELLDKYQSGKAYLWVPSRDLVEKLRHLQA